MARKLYLLLTLALVLPTAAQAADQTVTARQSNTFDPKDVTVDPGNKVTWTNGGGIHNVKFDDGSFEEPMDASFSPWTVSRTFDAPGTYRYYCEAHGGRNGVGMAGTVTVTGAAPPTVDDTAPVISGLEADPQRFRRKRGTRFEFELSELSHVEGTVSPVGRPRGRRGARFERDALAGENRIRYRPKRLRPGRYRLTLIATDAAGNASSPARTGFRIKRPR